MAERKSHVFEEKKKALTEDSEEYKEALQKQLDEIKEQTFSWASKLLVIGGTLYLSYSLVKRLIKSDDETPDKKEEASAAKPKKQSFIFSLIKKEITLYLLSLAKRKLLEILEKVTSSDEQEDLQDTDRQEEKGD